MTTFVRDESDSNAAAAADTLLAACGHSVVVRAKPKKRRTPFNTFDAEPKNAAVARGTHKAALMRATGIRI